MEVSQYNSANYSGLIGQEVALYWARVYIGVAVAVGGTLGALFFLSFTVISRLCLDFFNRFQ